MEITQKDISQHIMSCKELLDRETKSITDIKSYDQEKGSGLYQCYYFWKTLN